MTIVYCVWCGLTPSDTPPKECPSPRTSGHSFTTHTGVEEVIFCMFCGKRPGSASVCPRNGGDSHRFTSC